MFYFRMLSRALLRTSVRASPRLAVPSIRAKVTRILFFNDVHDFIQSEMSIMQWIQMEPKLEQVIFVLMGGLAAIVIAQLFGASPPTALPAGAPSVSPHSQCYL